MFDGVVPEVWTTKAVGGRFGARAFATSDMAVSVTAMMYRSLCLFIFSNWDIGWVFIWVANCWVFSLFLP